MRLTRVGARLLGVSDGSPIQSARVGNLVVAPDFEVVLFPTGDDAELVHDLDRFCVRGSHSGVLHFAISEKREQRRVQKHSGKEPQPSVHATSVCATHLLLQAAILFEDHFEQSSAACIEYLLAHQEHARQAQSAGLQLSTQARQFRVLFAQLRQQFR
jgi:hypothetical protein